MAGDRVHIAHTSELSSLVGAQSSDSQSAGTYDINGQAIEVDAWAEHKRDPDYWRVAVTVGGDWEVSTVWLGTNMGFGLGAPLIFETMVFGGPCDNDHAWYPTVAAAGLGHRMIANRVRAAVLDAS